MEVDLLSASLDANENMMLCVRTDNDEQILIEEKDIKREYLEETGLEITIESLYNIIQNNYTACKTNEEVKSIQLIMKVTSAGDEVAISPEHDEYGWFTGEEVNELIENELLTKAAKNAFRK